MASVNELVELVETRRKKRGQYARGRRRMIRTRVYTRGPLWYVHYERAGMSYCVAYYYWV